MSYLKHGKNEAEQPEILEFVEIRKTVAENFTFAEKFKDSGVKRILYPEKMKSTAGQVYRE